MKRLARELYSADEERFEDDFDTNKQELHELEEFESKKLRNRVAGYITRLAGRKQED